MKDCHPASSLDERPVIIASNRGPITLVQNQTGAIEMQRGSGGLVTALMGLARKIPMTWVACAQTAQDVAWGCGETFLGENQAIRLCFIDVAQEAYHAYYNIIANPLLWFLQHSMWDVPRTPIINRATWTAWEQGYMVVNQQFAEEILHQVREFPQKTVVMLQDYHLYLAPRTIRQARLPHRPSLLHFIHIPWPGVEYWSILPGRMRQQILEGLTAVDLLGFQTRNDGLNFLRTCEAYLPRASCSYKQGRVWFRNHATYIRDFPISIDVQQLKDLAESAEVASYEEEVGQIKRDGKLILRIDRIEPSKNIIRGFLAYEEMLELHPEHRKKVVFWALLIPSRLGVIEYNDYLDELMAAAGHVNARFSESDWEPVRVTIAENYPRAVAALKAYDVLLVNSVADGMNLVAKEGPVVNENDGVLVLSERAGAQQQLASGAMVVSPFDIYATAQALHQALILPESEKHENAERLRRLIELEDINAWLCDQLDTMEDLNL